jgi:hypothetical protein
MSTILTQTIGFAGVFIFLASYQIKSNRLLYFTQGIGCGMFCLQFFLLGGYSGCFSLALIICRNVMLMKYDEWSFVRSRIWVPLFSLISLAIMLATWTGWESIFPFISMVSGTMGYWTNNARYIRMSCLVCCSPSWIVYDMIISSWGGVLNESIGILSIIISIYRFGWKNMGDADFGKEPEAAAEDRAA